MSLPLTGFRVVELGTWVAVPAAAAMLADWGATVVKAEAPSGDPLRSLHDTGFAAVEPPVNAVFQGENHSKHSMRFDLTRTDDRVRLARLIAEADVFLTNLRSASLAKFELTYPVLAAAHPRLIYAQLTGYGRMGPDSDRAGYDYAAFWGRSGLLASMAEDGQRPPSPRPGVGDHAAALALCSGILVALLQRERTGLGQEVQVSLLASGLWANAMDLHLQQNLAGGQDQQRRPNPLFALYRTVDDRWLYLMLGQPERDWGRLCEALGLDPADARFDSQDRRVEHADELAELLEITLASEPLRTWATRLDGAGVAWGPCETVANALEDPQVLASCPPRLVRTTPPIPVIGHPVSLAGLARPPGAGGVDPPRLPAAPGLGEHDGRTWAELEARRTTAGINPGTEQRMSQPVTQLSVHERWMQVQERGSAQSDPRPWSYSELDAIRYALSVGAGATDLPWVYERHPGGLRVLPTLAIMPTVGAWDWLAQTLQLADDEIVLGEQSIALAGELPPALRTHYRHRLDGLYDKGASAMAQVSTVVEADRGVLATGISRFFVRDAGGFGGERGPAGLLPLSTSGDAGDETRWSAPAEVPLLYRLSGDLHPIHVDAEVARAAGQPRPPLHGMYLLGLLCREIVCRRERDVRAALIRYQGSAYPEEALLTRWWWDDGTIRGTVEAADRGAAVCKAAFAVG